jgi:hypothetical protein
MVMRRTILPRGGYKEGLTRLQLWLLQHLLSHIAFDIWDLILSEMEVTIAKGFKGSRQLLYAHWITYLIWKAESPMSAETIIEWSGATTEFPRYDMSQLL